MNSRFRLIIILLAVAGGAYLLWPTWQFSQLNGEREALEADTSEAGLLKLAQWDSLNIEDLDDARTGRIKLGLDLRGGVYFTMEVDIPALLEETADPDLTDETFDKVMVAVREEAAFSDDPVLDIFTAKFNEIAAPEGKSLLDYYDLNINDVTDEAVIDKLADNVSDAVEQAKEVITQRVNKYGLTEPSIQVQGSRRIIVELPDEKNPEVVRELLSKTARLEFKMVRNDADAIALFTEINNILREDDGSSETTETTPEENVTDETPETENETTDEAPEETVDGDDAPETTDTAADTTVDGENTADSTGDSGR